MTRLLLLALTACAPSIALPPPVRCVVDELPPGVLAEADLETQTVTVSPAWSTLPPSVQVVILAHEACHLRGHVSEASADCCAARAAAGVWGRTVVLDGAVWLQTHGRDVYYLVGCL